MRAERALPGMCTKCNQWLADHAIYVVVTWWLVAFAIMGGILATLLGWF